MAWARDQEGGREEAMGGVKGTVRRPSKRPPMKRRVWRGSLVGLCSNATR